MHSTQTAPRERPIIFSGPEVRAALEGKKTQARRVVRPLKSAPLPDRWDSSVHGALTYNGAGLVAIGPSGGRTAIPLPRCPFGAPGDRLWVREAWQAVGCWCGPRETDGGFIIRYRADEQEREAPCHPAWQDRDLASRLLAPERWRSPAAMPRWASRLTLEITDVRVERLAEINTADAIAEGLQIPTTCDGRLALRLTPNAAGKSPGDYLAPGRLFRGQPPLSADELARCHFADQWDAGLLGAPRYIRRRVPRGKPIDRYLASRPHAAAELNPFSWAANPWVWCLTFRRVEGAHG